MFDYLLFCLHALFACRLKPNPKCHRMRHLHAKGTCSIIIIHLIVAAIRETLERCPLIFLLLNQPDEFFSEKIYTLFIYVSLYKQTVNNNKIVNISTEEST